MTDATNTTPLAAEAQPVVAAVAPTPAEVPVSPFAEIREFAATPELSGFTFDVPSEGAEARVWYADGDLAAIVYGNFGMGAGVDASALAEFYAKAPDWLRALLEHIKELETASEEVFTPKQVASLWEFQQSGYFHPFTCPDRGDGRHFENGIDLGGLIPTVRGWICQCCDYTQDWAHEGMLSGQSVAAAKKMRGGVL